MGQNDFDVVDDPNDPRTHVYRRDGEAFFTVTTDGRGKKRVTFQRQQSITYQTTGTLSFGADISVRDAIANHFISPTEADE